MPRPGKALYLKRIFCSATECHRVLQAAMDGVLSVEASLETLFDAVESRS